ncbi:unnamed protein product [Durusdinium trenchii]|uniref:Uncharacterized protein n=1 Tax=Durusdinium trenchii TaxID=1381693 RepID=A0ABP0KAA9_9DINO
METRHFSESHLFGAERGLRYERSKGHSLPKRSHVPAGNNTTAILFVKEMTHMPQQHLFRGLLGLMLKSIAAWKAEARVPLEIFRKVLSFLRKDGWSGSLMYTQPTGEWKAIDFSPGHRRRLRALRCHMKS